MPSHRVPFAERAVLGGLLARIEVIDFSNEDSGLPVEGMNRQATGNVHQISMLESRELLRALSEGENQERAIALVKVQRCAGVLASIGQGAGDDAARDCAAQFDFVHVSLPAFPRLAAVHSSRSCPSRKLNRSSATSRYFGLVTFIPLRLVRSTITSSAIDSMPSGSLHLARTIFLKSSSRSPLELQSF